MTGGPDQRKGTGPGPARPVTLPAQPPAVPRPAGPPPDGPAPAGSALAGDPPAGVATAEPPGSTAGPAAPDGGAPGSGAPAPDLARTSPARKRADPWKAAFFVLAVVAIIAGVTWALLGSKFLVVRSITVTGAPDIPRGQVIAASGVRAGTPLIRISTGTVARRVEQLTLVESARVTRSWPNAITISIVERRAALAVRDPAGWDLIDRFGVVLHQVQGRPHGMPRLRTSTAPDQLRGNPAVFAAATVETELPARLAAKVRSIAAPTADTVTLYLRHGRIVVWGDASQTAVKARELAILMRGQARYFDVSNPRAVVTAPTAPRG
jgi:cell division protein FtsQ